MDVLVKEEKTKVVKFRGQSAPNVQIAQYYKFQQVETFKYILGSLHFK